MENQKQTVTMAEALREFLQLETAGGVIPVCACSLGTTPFQPAESRARIIVLLTNSLEKSICTNQQEPYLHLREHQ